MRDDAVRAYVLPPLICAEDELEALGDEFAENALSFCAEIVAGKTDHWSLLPFCDTHRDIPVYKYAYGNRCVLIAVEDDGSGEILVSIVLACRTGKPVMISGKKWDGVDLNALRLHFLLPRLQDYFP